MARINPKTQLFENLSDQEAKDLLEWASQITRLGGATSIALISQWIEFSGINMSLPGQHSWVNGHLAQVVYQSVRQKEQAERAELCAKLHIPEEANHAEILAAVDSLIDAIRL